MRFPAEGIQDQDFRSRDFFLFFLRNKICIRDVGEVSGPESQNIQVHVLYKDGDEFHSFYFERFVFNRMEIDLRNSGVFFFIEDIAELIAYRFLRLRSGVQIHFLFQDKVERTEIVQSGYMIAVFVRVNNGCK